MIFIKALEQKILTEGQVFPGNVLKVGSFLNHQLDVDFLMQMGEEIKNIFENEKVTKILTVEASGIAIAVAAAANMHVPVVFAKKNKTNNIAGDVYSAKVYSYTHSREYTIVIEKKYLTKDDKVLIVDDFLAHGNAINGLMEIVISAGASLVGVSCAIEKGFQKGGDVLRQKGIKVESLAVVETMSDDALTFRK